MATFVQSKRFLDILHVRRMDPGPWALFILLLNIKVSSSWNRLGLLAKKKPLNKGPRVPQCCCSFLHDVTGLDEVGANLVDLTFL